MVIYPMGHRSEKFAVNSQIDNANSLFRDVEIVNQVVFGCLGYGYYSCCLFDTFIIKVKIEPISRIRAVDESAVSLEVEIPYEVHDGDDKWHSQEVAIAPEVMVG